MHWHKEAEWSYVIKGQARITAIDQDGHTFIADVGEGDRRISLVFDDGAFSEDSTVLITDWLAHTPKNVLTKNFGVSESALSQLPTKDKYIFPAAAPASSQQDSMSGAGPVPQSFAHRVTAQDPMRMPGGTVRIIDTRLFPASKRIPPRWLNSSPRSTGVALASEWRRVQYYLEGTGRMTVFGSEGKSRTFDY